MLSLQLFCKHRTVQKFKKLIFKSLVSSSYKTSQTQFPNFKEPLAYRSVVHSPLSYIRHAITGILLKPKQKSVNYN